MSNEGHPQRLPLVVHIVPYDGIGGVEVAARSIADAKYEDFEFCKLYLLDDPLSVETLSTHSIGHRLNHPMTYFCALRRLLRLKPDVVVASLWRSCAVLIVLKLLRPSVRLVTFLHSASDVHVIDKVLNRVAMWLSCEVWGDSSTTLDARVPKALRDRTREISFQVMHQPRPRQRKPQPRFIFWGRLHEQKGLSRAIRLFAAVHQQNPQASFLIVGPDGGQLEILLNLAQKIGVGDVVQFLGPMERTAIFQLADTCSFYLQTSETEGMAMSVVEAMQMGLVPVVTPVGEIARYCHDGVNSLLVNDDPSVVERVSKLIANTDEFHQVAEAAAASWRGKTLYKDDVVAACRQLLLQ